MTESDPLRELVETLRERANDPYIPRGPRAGYSVSAGLLEQELDRLEERNVDSDLSMSPQDFASLAGVQTLSEEKRTNAEVHGFDHRFPQKQ